MVDRPQCGVNQIENDCLKGTVVPPFIPRPDFFDWFCQLNGEMVSCELPKCAGRVLKDGETCCKIDSKNPDPGLNNYEHIN